MLTFFCLQRAHGDDPSPAFGARCAGLSKNLVARRSQAYWQSVRCVVGQNPAPWSVHGPLAMLLARLLGSIALQRLARGASASCRVASGEQRVGRGVPLFGAEQIFPCDRITSTRSSRRRSPSLAARPVSLTAFSASSPPCFPPTRPALTAPSFVSSRLQSPSRPTSSTRVVCTP